MLSLQERLASIFGTPPDRGVPARIARVCGVKGATVSAWFNQPEKVSTMSRAAAENICIEFKLNINPAWLAEGVPPRLRRSNDLESVIPRSAISGPDLPSESVAPYVEDVSKLLHEFARSLNSDQKSSMRNLLRVILGEKDRLQDLDLGQLIPLLSDNSYKSAAAESPSNPLKPVTNIGLQLDTYRVQKTQGAGDGASYPPGTGGKESGSAGGGGAA